MLFLPIVLSRNKQSRLVLVGQGVDRVVAKVSNNRDLTVRGCKICTPPLASQLAFLSNNSKVDCTGQKVDNLRNRWAYIAVFGLILKLKSHAIP